MTTDDALGTFELLVLAAVQQCGHTAYGVTIHDEIERRTKRDVSIGAIHATLARLAAKNYVSFRFSDPLPIQGGRARKHAEITSAGKQALRRTMGAMLRMVDGLDLDHQS